MQEGEALRLARWLEDHGQETVPAVGPRTEHGAEARSEESERERLESRFSPGTGISWQSAR